LIGFQAADAFPDELHITDARGRKTRNDIDALVKSHAAILSSPNPSA
jgi:hypothetical protein